MKRKNFFRLIIVLVVSMFVASYWVYGNTQKQIIRLENAKQTIVNLKQELDNMAKLAIQLDKLDSITIDESTATKLNLQRHLALENTKFDFNLLSKQEQSLDGIVLYSRNININASLPYAEALELTDRLHNTNKIILSDIKFDANQEQDQYVNLNLTGTIYGLVKNNE